MAIDANYKEVTFGTDENGDAKELEVDNVTGALVIKLTATATTPSKPTAKIDANYKEVDFAVDAAGSISPLVCDSSGRLYVDTTNLTVS